ncbi:MAG: ComF family protein [Planctomycetaceae bacterium]|nr:ComF family protein [Planctomycetaceae bacterium]
MRTTWRGIKNLQQFFGHNYCKCCRTIISDGDEHFCSGCWSQLGLCFVDGFCTRCGREAGQFGEVNGCPKCEDEIFHFDAIACAGIYHPPLSELIVRFKLSNQISLLPVLTDFTQKTFSRMRFPGKIDYLVPVPLYWLNHFRRGFNQSHLLARSLDMPGVKVNRDLVKIRRTKSQTAVTFAERQKNLLGAFAVRKNHDFSGKNVCLIDDVKTTGATLNECAKVLKDAGAAKVFAFVLAVAGQKK